MEFHVIPDAEELAGQAAARIAEAARVAVERQGRFTLAFSGGRTPWRMYRLLSGLNLPWNELHLLQVDERIAPDGDAARNMTHMRENLIDRVPIPESNVHAMPVGDADLVQAAAVYESELEQACGKDRRIDMIHLGLGADGHTASLVPGDTVLGVSDRDVSITTHEYQGHRRMTLTFPALDRARSILWVVTGTGKAGALVRLLAGDRTEPAGRVARSGALVLADLEAATMD